MIPHTPRPARRCRGAELRFYGEVVASPTEELR
jgi:hypothetical protein